MIKVLSEGDKNKDKSEDGKMMRVYVSQCIALQYQANQQVLERTKSIKDTLAVKGVKGDKKDESMRKFKDLARRVVEIKQRGASGLI